MKIRLVAWLTAACILFSLSGCETAPESQTDSSRPAVESSNVLSEELEKTEEPISSLSPYAAFYDQALVSDAQTEFGMRYQLEDGILTDVSLQTDYTGYTGDGAVGNFEKDSSAVLLYLELPEAGFYDVTIHAAGVFGEKTNTICFNDNATSEFKSPASDTFEPSTLSGIYLEKGINKIEIKKSWGWILLDTISLQPSPPFDTSIFDVEPTLVNPNAAEYTKRLMKFITDQYGKKIIVGQHSDQGFNSPEFKAIFQETGKYPALLELDLIDYSPTRAAYGTSSMATEYAISWAKEQGGIVGFCWHWNAPKDLLNTQGHEWWSGFYTHATTFDLEKAMNGEDPEGYANILRDIDVIAEQLKRLQEENIPVLWRPLHEASGGWFWWGAKGPEPYIALYRLLYDRLTNYHGLNNLIWVWNGQAKDWYPGDEYVDIISEDIYPPPHDYSSQTARFQQALDYTDTRKVIALSENGVIPDPDLIFRDHAPWAWYATWQGKPFVLQIDGVDIYSEEQTEISQLVKMYHSENAITLDELPDLTSYPLD
ncbi:MAG TPA: beta-mannosidase [Firmicutes bacterium]|nr:beta-mannosidase [Bacillota bacterium]